MISLVKPNDWGEQNNCGRLRREVGADRTRRELLEKAVLKKLAMDFDCK